MNLALMSHDRRKELMVQFCIAYCGILSRHSICATGIRVSEVKYITVEAVSYTHLTLPTT